MSLLKEILKEIKNVPVNRHEELYHFIRTLKLSDEQLQNNAQNRKKILSFGGAFSDLTKKEYSDFLKQTKKVRATLFNRNID